MNNIGLNLSMASLKPFSAILSAPSISILTRSGGGLPATIKSSKEIRSTSIISPVSDPMPTIVLP
jgi:hypothetical protein